MAWHGIYDPTIVHSVDHLCPLVWTINVVPQAITGAEQQMHGSQITMNHQEEIDNMEEQIQELKLQVDSERAKFMTNAPAAAEGISIPVVDVHDSVRAVLCWNVDSGMHEKIPCRHSLVHQHLL